MSHSNPKGNKEIASCIQCTDSLIDSYSHYKITWQPNEKAEKVMFEITCPLAHLPNMFR